MSGQDLQDRVQRFSRQIVLPEVGPPGQRAWEAARVRVDGAGAAAEAARTWLAAAGVQIVHEGCADRVLRLEGDGLEGALAGVLAAGSTLIGLIPGKGPPETQQPPLPACTAAGDPLVVVVGAGGLGCPAALGLGLAGIRRLRVIDDDLVETSNLPRQVLHREADIGRPKAISARDALLRRFPGIDVEARFERLDPGNAESLLRDADLVIEGSDNFPTKFRVNAAAAAHGVPAVVAGVLRYEGQAIAVDPRTRGACYRCLFPRSPVPGVSPTCSSAGILGPVAGALGLWQAALGLGMLRARAEGRDGPSGRLWIFSAWTGRWTSFLADRHDGCPACGPDPDDPSLRGAAEGETCRPR